jgi:hypothetical protein
MDKRPSLLRKFVNHVRKIFYNIGSNGRNLADDLSYIRYQSDIILIESFNSLDWLIDSINYF